MKYIYPSFFRYRRLRKQSPHRRGRLNFAHRLGELLEPLINSGKDVTFTNDIALVKLSRKVRFTDKVQPIKMPKGGFSYQGYQAYVSGWGIQSPLGFASAAQPGAARAQGLPALASHHWTESLSPRR